MIGLFIGLFLGFVLSRNIWGGIIGGAIGFYFIDIPTIRKSVSGRRIFSSEYDKNSQTLFYKYLCMAIAKVAKIDGAVSNDEINEIEKLFKDLNFDSNLRKFAIDTFRDAKRTMETAEDITVRFANYFRGIQPRQVYMISLCRVAISDGNLSSSERSILENVAQILNLRLSDYVSFSQSNNYNSSTPTDDVGLQSAYETLGVNPSMSEAEIKRAYHQRCKELHPDVLRSKGLGEFAIKTLELELKRVNDAYQTIKKYGR